jgi:PAS domain S-box-containing protein
MTDPRAVGVRFQAGDEMQAFASEGRESTVRAWARPASVLAVLIVLVGLGIANVTMRARVHEVEDGVLWGARGEGVTALEVAAGSAGALAGIQKGDLLLAVNGVPVQAPADVVEYQHKGQPGTKLTYTLLRLGTRQALEISLAAVTRPLTMYFVLAAVGLFTLIVGASVRLRRPHDQATLHFFWLCVAFFGAFTFSFNGPFDRLDWTFYWGDAVAMALLPPLLLHFTLVFPERPGRRNHPVWLPIMYVPAIVLGAARVFVIARGPADGQFFSGALALLDRAEPLYLFICAGAACFVLMRAFGEITSLTGRRQLRWIAWGTVLGVGPFGLAYALPWAFGFDPPLALQLTAVPLGLVPLAFASAIVRYRLRDVEVIIKRGVAYTAFFAASGALYVALRRAVGFAFQDNTDPHNWVIALLATIVIVLLTQPVREAVQNALDRVFYRDRYDYRRALVGFARDLNTDLDVVRLSQRLVSRIVETLVVDRMALMLADERMGDFRSIGDFGFAELVPRLQRSSSFVTRLDGGHNVALDDPISAAWFAAEEVEFWRDQGIYYFVPCVFEGVAIAVLALGRKDNDEPFNSEDLGLLTAVAGQVATAIENGRLYRQLHLKAEEIGRMREFNDNILESLDDGLVVFGSDERIIRWNHALEHFYGVSRVEAIGRTLSEVFDLPFVEALRAAWRENPRGASLFKVPIAGRSRGDDVDNQLLVNVTAVPLQSRGGPGALPGTILLLENVTEHARLEEQLQISEKMASIGLLAAGVAHEVNTPLTGISSYTQMLLEQADPSDPRTLLLEKIERQTFRAAKIVNGLLTLSRPGTPGGERTNVDLNVVVGDVIALLEHQFEAGKIKLRRELSSDPVPVLAIEHQLQQVFLNLFLNARDAMPRGGWLTVHARVDGDRAIVEVADTGSGIPPEQLARIYDPFFTTKAIGRGTGLGLSISYGIVREHDGEIRCDSAIGQGTRFALTFPLGAARNLKSGTRS